MVSRDAFRIFAVSSAALALAALLASCASAPSSSGFAGAPGDSAAESADSAPAGAISGEKPAFDVKRAPSWPELNLAIGEPRGWTLPSEDEIRGGRTIDLFDADLQAKARVSTVLHSPGEPSRLERLTETELRNVKVRLTEQRWSSREKIRWDGLDAILFEIGGNTDGGALQAAGLGAWDGSRYYFVVLTHEGLAPRQEIRKNFEDLAKRIARIERPVPPSAKTDFTKPFPGIRSEPLGYELKPKRTVWYDWAEGKPGLGDPEAALTTKGEELNAALFANRLEADLARAPQIFDAYLLQLGVLPGQDEISVSRKALAEENVDVRFSATRREKGIDFDYRGRFVWNGDRALMLVAWHDARQSAKHAADVAGLLDGLSVFDAPEAEPSPAERRSTAFLLNQIGLIQLQQDDALGALGFFEKANRLDPDEPLYLINCGFVYQLKRLLGPGIQHFESQPELVKSHGKLLSILGELHEASYNYDRALECYNAALRFYPDDEELRINVSDALWGLGYRKQSLEAVESLYRLRPSVRLGVYLAKTYMGLDRNAEAADLLTQLDSGRPASRDMGATLSEALLAQNRHREALQAAAQTISLFGADHRLLVAQGKAQFYSRQFKDALKSFERAAKDGREDEEIASLLAATQSLLGSGDNKALRKPIEPVLPAGKPAELLKRGGTDGADSSAPAIVRFRQESVFYAPKKPWRVTEELLVQVLDERGVSLFKEFSFTFLPGYDRVHANRIELLDSALKTKWTGSLSDWYVTSEVGEEAASEHQVAHFPVRGLEPGDFVHMQVSRTSIESSPWPPFVDHRASRHIPVALDRLVLTGDTADLRIEEYGPIERAEPDAPGHLVWEARDPLRLGNELHMPHYQDLAGGVLIAGSRTWTDVGKEYEALIGHQKKGSIAAREKAYEIKGSLIDPQEIVDKVVRWVRENIRYRNVPFGGHAVVPANSGETLRRRWGDCKDKSLLAQEMLATLGVKSELTLVSLGEPVSPALPTIHQFDHMILHIPGSEKWREQFVDLTELGGTRRAVPYGLEGGAALVVDGDSSRLAIMPMLEIALEHHVDLDHVAQLKADGGAEFRDRIELRGKFAAGMRERLGEKSEAELARYVQEWLDDEIPGSTLLDVRLENADRTDLPFGISLSYAVKKMFSVEKGRVSFRQPGLFERGFMKMPRSSARRHPVRLPNAHVFSWKLRLLYPESWTVDRALFKGPKSADYVDWKGSSDAKRGELSFSADWETHAVFAEPNEYPQLQREWEEVVDAATPAVEFKGAE